MNNLLSVRAVRSCKIVSPFFFLVLRSSFHAGYLDGKQMAFAMSEYLSLRPD
jgi:hypothetical protein